MRNVSKASRGKARGNGVTTTPVSQSEPPMLSSIRLLAPVCHSPDEVNMDTTGGPYPKGIKKLWEATFRAEYPTKKQHFPDARCNFVIMVCCAHFGRFSPKFDYCVENSIELTDVTEPWLSEYYAWKDLFIKTNIIRDRILRKESRNFQTDAEAMAYHMEIIKEIKDIMGLP